MIIVNNVSMITFARGKIPWGAGTDLAEVNNSLNRSNTFSYNNIDIFRLKAHACTHTNDTPHTHLYINPLMSRILLFKQYDEIIIMDLF